MARAYGSSAHLLMKRETTYGQAATGNYIRMPKVPAFFLHVGGSREEGAQNADRSVMRRLRDRRNCRH